MERVSLRLWGMIFADSLLNAKVVVEQTKGMPSFLATALPHTAMESATMQSGFSRSMARHTGSSSDRVVSTSTRVDRARSAPIFAPSSLVRCSWASLPLQEMNSAPASSIFSRNSS